MRGNRQGKEALNVDKLRPEAGKKGRGGKGEWETIWFRIRPLGGKEKAQAETRKNKGKTLGSIKRGGWNSANNVQGRVGSRKGAGGVQRTGGKKVKRGGNGVISGRLSKGKLRPWDPEERKAFRQSGSSAQKTRRKAGKL